jgi:pantetheine-phosphate adenylyltransferase
MVCLMTSLQYAFLSSTIVKEIAYAGGSVSQFVPALVAEALRAKIGSRKE